MKIFAYLSIDHVAISEVYVSFKLPPFINHLHWCEKAERWEKIMHIFKLLCF